MKGSYFSAVSAVLWFTAITALPSRTDSVDIGDGHRKINFDCTIPRHNKDLPLFSLGRSSPFPSDKLGKILAAAAPGVKLAETKSEDGSRYFYDNDLLVGFYDKSTGETSVFPKLEQLKPASNIDTSGLSRLIGDNSIVPKDDTQHSIVVGSRLSGSQKKVDGNASPPATYLLEGIIQRQIQYDNNLHPVCGPGSRGSFHFGVGNTLLGLTHNWKPAQTVNTKITPLSQDIIQSNIAASLVAANLNTNVTVNAIDLCFYDSGNKYIQPVYRFNATVSHPFGLSDDLFIGYVPAGGKEQEPLPSLNAPVGQVLPTFSNTTTTNDTDTQDPPVIARSIGTKQKRSSITVGRYAMSNDQYSPQIVVDENAFWNGLSSVSSTFVNSQYYWAEEFIYEGSAPTFVDSVNVAFTEGHGNVHMFTTNELQPNWGPVYISDDLPASGYGPGAGGNLAYWIIRACDTISTPLEYSAADFHKAFDPWWKVFNGMHAVMGYRTLAAVYDNEMGNVGKALAKGQSVVHGWMNAAAGGGKTSAVVVCGHSDDTVYNIANLGRPDCLTIWWLN